MGCLSCKSAQDKQDVKAKQYLQSTIALMRSLHATAPQQHCVSFFSCLYRAICSSLQCTDSEAVDFLNRAVAHCEGARDELASFLPRRNVIRPNKLRARMIEVWLQFDKDSSGDMSASEIDNIIVAMNFTDEQAAEIRKEVKKVSGSMTFLQFETCTPRCSDG